MFNPASTSPQAIINTAVTRLLALRAAFQGIQDFQGWLSAQSDTDLIALGFSASDLSALRSAMADANEEATLHAGGGLGTYTLPYNFSASQRLVIGPQ